MNTQQLKKYNNLRLLKALREGVDEDGESGEGQFGLVPLTKDPNSILAHSVGKNSPNQDGLHSHPLLSRSAQFSGIDTHLTPEPTSNEEAQENYPQYRLDYQAKQVLQQRQRQRKAPPRLVR